MPDPSYLILQCRLPECRFRFPSAEDATNGNTCPRCGGPTKIEINEFGNNPDRASDQNEFVNPIRGLLDNLRSVYNVGSIFRTANGAGLAHLHLCGITPTPDNPRLNKTSLGAEMSIPWSHHNNSIDIAEELSSKGFYLIAFESGTDNQWMPGAWLDNQTAPILVIVGNELSGVDPGLMDICDSVWSIPMIGEKTSLNVTVAFGIATYFLRLYSRSER
jgi:tRNA G18 (ribose-2'-O)-methylase SpoU